MKWLVIYFMISLVGLYMTFGKYDTKKRLEKEKDEENKNNKQTDRKS